MNWDQVFEAQGYKPVGDYRPNVPDPGVAETGARPCNAPVTLNGRTYYCERWNRLYRHWWGFRNWNRPNKPHDGPHCIEWWS